MDQYILVLCEDSMTSFINIEYNESIEHCATFCNDQSSCTDLFAALNLKSKKYIKVIQIDPGHDVVEDDMNEKQVSWTEWDSSYTNQSSITVKTSFIQASHILFSLANHFSYPGSYFLNVYWYLSSINPELVRKFTSVIGVLKKLKLWNLAEINIIVESDLMQQNISLKSISTFLEADFHTVSSLCDFLPQWNDSILWKGSICLNSSEFGSVGTLQKFCLKRHNCQTPFVHEEDNQFSDINSGSVWMGNIIKALDIIDVSTIPLLLLSDNVSMLECSRNNLQGNELYNSILNYKNAGVLCRMDYICSKQPFSSCPEVSSKCWKEVLVRSPHDLRPPNFTLHEASRHLYFIMTVACENNCLKYEKSTEKMQFHAQALLPLVSLDGTLLFEQEHKLLCNPHNAHSITNQQYRLLNSTSVSSHDREFGRFFSFVLQKWNEEKSKEISLSKFQHLILESWDCFNHHFDNELCKPQSIQDNLPASCHNSQKHNFTLPEFAALQNKENLCEGSGMPKLQEKPLERVWSNSKVIKSKSDLFATEEILNYFDKVGSRKTLDSLSSLSTENKFDIPNRSKLQDFASAIATSYHGVSFNIDAQGSEKKDYRCRKMVERLVRFETLSVGSKAPVSSPLTMDLNESPMKSEVQLHTPGKKKKLQKMAEKLYKKRVSVNSSKHITARPIKTSMVLRSTPTKNKSGSLNKQKLLSSPSIHKMSLRSSTPTKSETNKFFYKKKILFSTKSDVKQLQKTYVHDNKKRLQKMVLSVLAENNVNADHPKFNQCAKRLYNVSMAFLRDLKSSKDLENTMKHTVKENVKLVLSFETTSNDFHVV